MNNSQYPQRKFFLRPHFVIGAVLLLILCMIIAIPLTIIHGAQKHQSHKHATPTPNTATTITLQNAPTGTATGTLANSSEAKKSR